MFIHPLTVNHPDVSECGHISGPPTADLHPTHVPPRVRFLQVFHGYREHLLDLVINNTELIAWVGHAGVIRPSQTGAELPCSPLTPVFYVVGILGLVMAREYDGLTFRDDQLVRSGHMAQEVCKKVQNWISRFHWSMDSQSLALFMSRGQGQLKARENHYQQCWWPFRFIFILRLPEFDRCLLFLFHYALHQTSSPTEKVKSVAPEPAGPDLCHYGASGKN